MSSPTADGYYARHIFFCLNERKNGEDSCALHHAQSGFDHCKSRVKAEGLAGVGRVRVNKAGCLDRCAGGPVAVVYPEGVWYRCEDASAIERVVVEHLEGGREVSDLVFHRLGSGDVHPEPERSDV